MKEGDLHKHQRCQKQRRKRYGKQDRRGCIANRVSIEERPAIVNSKSRIVDWKGDTIIGNGHQGVVTTHIERKTKSTPSPMTMDWSSPSTRISPKRCLPTSTLLILILPGNEG